MKLFNKLIQIQHISSSRRRVLSTCQCHCLVLLLEDSMSLFNMFSIILTIPFVLLVSSIRIATLSAKLELFDPLGRSILTREVIRRRFLI